MKTNLILRLIGICTITIAAAYLAMAQTQSRSITSDDFANKRPPARTGAPRTNLSPKPRPVSYNRVRTDKNLIGRKPSPKPKPPRTAKPVITEIGVTMWKLRAPGEGENGYFFNVLDENKMRTKWLGERTSVDTIFAPGDKLRFAVESSISGYLYVIGRESYSDGRFGAPYPIFPESPSDDNSVRPGMLFDFPDQREDLPYLMLNPKKENYTGEIMTIIISPRPLTIIKIDKDGNVKDSDELRDLELSAEVEIFSRTDMADKLYSKAESTAACGVKARQLEREKGCGGAGALTREESLPQSIYQVKAASGRPAVAFVKLTVR